MAVNDDDVREIIDLDAARDTSPFISVAQLLYDEELASKGYSGDRADKIVLYLAAHFACVTEERGGLRRSKMGDSDESYKAPDNNEVGLASTRYGQMAMLLDKSGTLASMSTNGGLKAKFTVIAQDKDYGFLPRGFFIP